MLDHLILKTPLIRYLGESVGSNSEIYLKAENLQPFGSYKIRGVAHLLKNLDPRVLAKGLSAASAGNMAQAVAYGARIAKVPCRIFVPETAPEIKKEAIRKLGAELIELPY
jgi:threonine dehydratase